MVNNTQDQPRKGSRAKLYVKRLLVGVLILALLLMFGFIGWGLTPSKASTTAQGDLKTSSTVKVVKDNKGIWFMPVNQQTKPQVGYIFYPGGHVDARAYAPLAMELASRGHVVVIVPMPLSLAVLSPNKGASILDMNTQKNVSKWSMVGHSLGGSMAATFVSKLDPAQRDKIEEVIYLAAYPPNGVDLKALGVKSASIIGSNDGVVNQENMKAAESQIGRSLIIEGGNHAQFGSYGPQKGDNPATISPQEQWTQTADFIVAGPSAKAAHAK